MHFFGHTRSAIAYDIFTEFLVFLVEHGIVDVLVIQLNVADFVLLFFRSLITVRLQTL